MPDVALVCMPYADPCWPSLGLSSLKVALGSQGISAEVIYPSIWAATWSEDPDAVKRVAQCNPVNALAGEWVFAEECFGSNKAADGTYIDYLGSLGDVQDRQTLEIDQLIRDTRLLRNEVPAFLEKCMAQVNWGQFQIVGFTTSFQQTLSSIALANRIKSQFPSTIIAFGGANCEAIMGLELLRSFSVIDMVCIGEGETVFPEAARRILDGQSVRALPGVVTRNDLSDGHLHVEPLSPALVTDMDSLHFPDFDEFFEEYHRCRLPWTPRLVFESSRGCWWGAKNACRFCGQNGSRLAFRSRSPEKALEQLRYIVERYGRYAPLYQATDTILDYRYMSTLLPRLKELGLIRNLFYEVKANLSEEQVKLLAESGITMVQAGIETLSTPILRLMNKGVSALQCIQLLKWGQQYGVQISWNVIAAIPHEPPGEYARMADLIDSLTHLQPPEWFGPVRFDRFSSYFESPGTYGISNVKPYPAYEHCFRNIQDCQLFNMAYFFVGDYLQRNAWRHYTDTFRQQVQVWRSSYKHAKVYWFPVDDVLYIQDTRPIARHTHQVIGGLDRFVLEATNQIANPRAIAEYAEKRLGACPTAEDINAALSRLIQAKLVIADGDQYLSVVVPLSEESLTDSAKQHVSAVRRLIREGAL